MSNGTVPLFLSLFVELTIGKHLKRLAFRPAPNYRTAPAAARAQQGTTAKPPRVPATTLPGNRKLPGSFNSGKKISRHVVHISPSGSLSA